MMKPTVHLNGSSANVLIERLSDVRAAVRAALAALELAAPNERDYYPVPGSGDAARRWYVTKATELRALDRDLAATIHHIDDQVR